MPSSVTSVGSSLSFVTAINESVGYFYQSYILDEVGGVIAGPAGALVYTIAAIVAITGFMMTGRYKMGAWFLIAPGVVFALLNSRTETNGSLWLFGGDERPRELVEVEVRNIIETNNPALGETARVSSLFGSFNRVTSHVVQEIVRVLNNGRDKADLRFILRAELAGYMRSQNPMDNGLRELLHFALMRQCGQFVNAARELRDPKNPQSVRDAHDALYKKLRETKDIRLNEAAVEWIAARLAAGEAVPGFTESQAPTQSFATVQDALKEAVRNTEFSCEDIWKIVYIAAIDHAKRILQSAKGYLEANDITGDQLKRFYQDFARINGIKTSVETGDTPEQLDALVKAVALFTLRNEMQYRSNTSFIDDYVRRGQTRNLRTPAGVDVADLERRRVYNLEWAEKTRAMTIAATLPYYQGIGLLLLAMVFPFFTLLVLVPGKYQGFFLWFQLWVWLKSWDIGYAVVMMLDDLLFSIMGTGPAVAPNDVQLSEDFITAIFSLQELDPTFQLGTYYSIIALALQSIPLISGYLILGGASAGTNFISKGLQSYADNLASGAQSTQGQYHVTGLRNAALRTEISMVKRGLENAKAGIGEPGAPRPILNPLRGNIHEYTPGRTFEGGRPFGPLAEQRRSFPPLGISSAEGADEYAQQAQRMRFFGGIAKEVAKGAGEGDQDDDAGQKKDQNGDRAKKKKWSLGEKAHVIEKWVGTSSGALGRLADRIGQASLSVREAELSAITDWDRFHAMNSYPVQEFASLSRVYGGFELPWVEGGGWSAELDAEVTRMKETLRIIRQSSESLTELFEPVMSKREKTEKSNGSAPTGPKGSGGKEGGGAGAAALLFGNTVSAGAESGSPGILEKLLGWFEPTEAGAAEIPPELRAVGNLPRGITRDALERAANSLGHRRGSLRTRPRLKRRETGSSIEGAPPRDERTTGGLGPGEALVYGEERTIRSIVGAPAFNQAQDPGRVAPPDDRSDRGAAPHALPLGRPEWASDGSSRPSDGERGAASALTPDRESRTGNGVLEETSTVPPEIAGIAQSFRNPPPSDFFSSEASVGTLSEEPKQQRTSDLILRPESPLEPSFSEPPAPSMIRDDRRSIPLSGTDVERVSQEFAFTSKAPVSADGSPFRVISDRSNEPDERDETGVGPGIATTRDDTSAALSSVSLTSASGLTGETPAITPWTHPKAMRYVETDEVYLPRVSERTTLGGEDLPSPTASALNVSQDQDGNPTHGIHTVPMDGFPTISLSAPSGIFGAEPEGSRDLRNSSASSSSPLVEQAELWGSPASLPLASNMFSEGGERSEIRGVGSGEFSEPHPPIINSPSGSLNEAPPGVPDRSVGVQEGAFLPPTDQYFFEAERLSPAQTGYPPESPAQARSPFEPETHLRREESFGVHDTVVTSNWSGVKLFGDEGAGIVQAGMIPPLSEWRTEIPSALPLEPNLVQTGLSHSGEVWKKDHLEIAPASYVTSGDMPEGAFGFAAPDQVGWDGQRGKQEGERGTAERGELYVTEEHQHAERKMQELDTLERERVEREALERERIERLEAEQRVADAREQLEREERRRQEEERERVEREALERELERHEEERVAEERAQKIARRQEEERETPAEEIERFSVIPPSVDSGAAAFPTEPVHSVTFEEARVSPTSEVNWTERAGEPTVIEPTVSAPFGLGVTEEAQSESIGGVPVTAAPSPGDGSSSGVENEGTGGSIVSDRMRRRDGRTARGSGQPSVEVIVDAPTAQSERVRENAESETDDQSPSVGPTMGENRLSARRQFLESIAQGVVESFLRLRSDDPVRKTFSAVGASDRRTVTYRATDGFDRPIVVIGNLEAGRHLLIVDPEVFQELCPGRTGIAARPTRELGFVPRDETLVMSVVEGGALVGAEEALQQHVENGGDRATIDRLERQASEIRADLAGQVEREIARLDGALDFGALRAQNDYLTAFHNRPIFRDDEAITRHLAENRMVTQNEYVANLVERYARELIVRDNGPQHLLPEFVERLPHRPVFEESYVKPLSSSVFSWRKERSEELKSWSLTERLNGGERISFETVRAIGVGLRPLNLSFQEHRVLQQEVVALLTSELAEGPGETHAQAPLTEEQIETLTTAFRYTVGEGAELYYEDYQKLVDRLVNGNATERKRWTPGGEMFEKLLRTHGVPQGFDGDA